MHLKQRQIYTAFKAAAYRDPPVSPARARELYNLSFHRHHDALCLNAGVVIDGKMVTGCAWYPPRTEAEDRVIKALWRTMPGNTCYLDALNRIAKGEEK